MKENIYISGFADEISPDFTEQLKTVTSLGMHYISLRLGGRQEHCRIHAG